MTVSTLAIDLRTVALGFHQPKVPDHAERTTHILVSLAADPPAIFCTRKVSSSCLSSCSCLSKSFFDLIIKVQGLYPVDMVKQHTWIGVRRP